MSAIVRTRASNLLDEIRCASMAIAASSLGWRMPVLINITMLCIQSARIW